MKNILLFLILLSCTYIKAQDTSEMYNIRYIKISPADSLFFVKETVNTQLSKILYSRKNQHLHFLFTTDKNTNKLPAAGWQQNKRFV